MADLCVAHLVRKQNGPKPLRTFLKSYREHDAGVDHDLLLILKGFGSIREFNQMYDFLNPDKFKARCLPDEGYDVGSYMKIADMTRYKYYYFCNSYSRILCKGWLSSMFDQISDRRVGLVGTTGSWASIYSYAMLALGKPSAYQDFIDPTYKPEEDPNDQPAEDDRQAENNDPATSVPPRRPVFRRLIGGTVRRIRRLAGRLHVYNPFPVESDAGLAAFEPFPTFHIRTNAFLISRESIRKMRPCNILTKWDAYKFESGKSSLTSRVLATGREVLVVGRDGRGYARDRWHESNTFWQRDQANLMVADNQTNDYLYGSAKKRDFLSHFAWCEKADPFLINAVSEPGRAGDLRWC
jgi:hypothetical protein